MAVYSTPVIQCTSHLRTYHLPSSRNNIKCSKWEKPSHHYPFNGQSERKWPHCGRHLMAAVLIIANGFDHQYHYVFAHRWQNCETLSSSLLTALLNRRFISYDIHLHIYQITLNCTYVVSLQILPRNIYGNKFGVETRRNCDEVPTSLRPEEVNNIKLNQQNERPGINVNVTTELLLYFTIQVYRLKEEINDARLFFRV